MPTVANTRRQTARLIATLAALAPALSLAADAPVPSKGDTCLLYTSDAADE